ncbi:hypothetical protein G5B38_00510 [Pseudohalocynthiibacter aestuariivivens]|uniref:Lipoprotein n=1 Tax=Roseovarius pelagicus TaxID=2980108 RepID=A0ABY6DCU1_9RHOB|nr:MULTISPECIES: hypothetical protein [Rhodobacterales]QIE44128.1 hypothetical protein G5B38_00510 [Pseudohalocynthiibacter aestuariivivens]UXX83966.1 hypothetical protein N7U68_04740 [Roseovarius pelagicus]
MTHTRIITSVLAAMLVLGACAKPGEREMFDGKYYPAKAKKDGDRREDFVVTVRRVGQGIEGARKAGRHEGIRYCVETYGDSAIEWKPGSDPEAATVVTEGDALTMRGSCVEW